MEEVKRERGNSKKKSRDTKEFINSEPTKGKAYLIDSLNDSEEEAQLAALLEADNEVESGKTSFLSTCLGFTCFPFTLCCSWYVLKEKQEAIRLNYGKFISVETSPGCHFANCWGRDIRRVSKQIVSVDLPNTKVVDRNGNPLLVSGIVVYHISNSKKAALDVANAHQYIVNESQAVLKKIVSMYPYESNHEEGEKEELSLKTESFEIGKKMVLLLQKQVITAGAKIHSFQFNEMSYAPEIASGMLKRQQAKAMVAARKKIVEGAVEIAYGAVDQLQERGIKMQPEERTKLVSNLLTVICGDNENQQTVSTNHKGHSAPKPDYFLYGQHAHNVNYS